MGVDSRCGHILVKAPALRDSPKLQKYFIIVYSIYNLTLRVVKKKKKKKKKIQSFRIRCYASFFHRLNQIGMPPCYSRFKMILIDFFLWRRPLYLGIQQIPTGFFAGC